jgi:hypothetical protein
MCQYTKVRGELTKQANPYIVRTFPKFSANPAGPDFGKYCKYQLIKFKPWEGQPSNAWNNEDEMFMNTYDFFLMTDEFAEENVFRYSDETDRVNDVHSGQTFENDPSDNQDDDMKVKLILMRRKKLMIGCCCAELDMPMCSSATKALDKLGWKSLQKFA